MANIKNPAAFISITDDIRPVSPLKPQRTKKTGFVNALTDRR
jgi:hypothetical protein